MNSGENKANSQPSGNPVFGKPVSRLQLTLAFFVAAGADAILFPLQIAEPFSLIIDFVTAFLLFVILGWRVILLPALLAEATPGVGIFPLWVLVVGSIALFGTIKKPGSKENFPMRPEPYPDSEQNRRVPPVLTITKPAPPLGPLLISLMRMSPRKTPNDERD
jgi:hypothetical protein